MILQLTTEQIAIFVTTIMLVSVEVKSRGFSPPITEFIDHVPKLVPRLNGQLEAMVTEKGHSKVYNSKHFQNKKTLQN